MMCCFIFASPAQIDHEKTAICRPETPSTRVLIWCLQAGNPNSGMNPIRPIAEKHYLFHQFEFPTNSLSEFELPTGWAEIFTLQPTIVKKIDKMHKRF